MDNRIQGFYRDINFFAPYALLLLNPAYPAPSSLGEASAHSGPFLPSLPIHGALLSENPPPHSRRVQLGLPEAPVSDLPRSWGMMSTQLVAPLRSFTHWPVL